VERDPLVKGATLAVLATLAAAVLWGTSFSVNDRGLHDVGPATFAMLRFALAGVVMLAAAALLRRASLAPLRAWWFWLLAAMNALGFLLQYLGQTLTTPARTALFVNASAFAVALLERLVFRAPLGRARVAAIAAGVGGATVLVAAGDPSSLRSGQLWGDLLTIASGLAWSVYFILNRKALQAWDPVNVTAWTFALSALLLVPALALDARPLAVASGWGLFAVAYAGLVTSALAYGLWSFGLQSLRPSVSAVLLLVEILVATLISLATKRETFGWLELVGAAFLLGAVLAMTLIAEKDAAEP
jgi:DME family drug/metabolite transporter